MSEPCHTYEHSHDTIKEGFDKLVDDDMRVTHINESCHIYK